MTEGLATSCPVGGGTPGVQGLLALPRLPVRTRLQAGSNRDIIQTVVSPKVSVKCKGALHPASEAGRGGARGEGTGIKRAKACVAHVQNLAVNHGTFVFDPLR